MNTDSISFIKILRFYTGFLFLKMKNREAFNHHMSDVCRPQQSEIGKKKKCPFEISESLSNKYIHIYIYYVCPQLYTHIQNELSMLRPLKLRNYLCNTPLSLPSITYRHYKKSYYYMHINLYTTQIIFQFPPSPSNQSAQNSTSSKASQKWCWFQWWWWWCSPSQQSSETDHDARYIIFALSFQCFCCQTFGCYLRIFNGFHHINCLLVFHNLSTRANKSISPYKIF